MVERRLGMAEALGSKQKRKLIQLLQPTKIPARPFKLFRESLSKKENLQKNIIMDQ